MTCGFERSTSNVFLCVIALSLSGMATKSAWDFFGVNFLTWDFFGFRWKILGFFWVLNFGSIRSSPSLKFRSTPPGAPRELRVHLYILSSVCICLLCIYIYIYIHNVATSVTDIFTSF